MARGKYDVRVSIEGSGFTSIENQIISLKIIESCDNSCPSMELQFFSDGNVYSNSHLYDGQKIYVTFRNLETGIELDETRCEFRIFNFSITSGLNQAIVNVNAVLDTTDIFESKKESFIGTSSQVYSGIAERMGISSDVDPTNDSQVWIRPGIRGGDFLNEVANHAWNSENDFFAWGLRKEKELVLANIRQRMSREVDWFFKKYISETRVSREERDVLFSDFEISSKSGTMNNLFGYGQDLYSFSIEKGESSKVELGEFKLENRKRLQVNKEIAEYRNNDSMPIDCGNVHENYYRAYYQNLRYKSLYSTQLKCTTIRPRNVRLLDTCNVSIPFSPIKDHVSIYSGKYIISKIVTKVDFKRKNLAVNYYMVRESIDEEGGDLEALY